MIADQSPLYYNHANLLLSHLHRGYFPTAAVYPLASFCPVRNNVSLLGRLEECPPIRLGRARHALLTWQFIH